MLGYVATVHIYFYKNLIFSLKGRRGLQRQNCSRHFGFSNIFEISLKDPKSTGNWSFRKSNQTVWLCAVWHCAEPTIKIYRSVTPFWIFTHFNFPTLGSVTLCGVTFFANIFAKTHILAKPWKKNRKKSRDTASLIENTASQSNFWRKKCNYGIFYLVDGHKWQWAASASCCCGYCRPDRREEEGGGREEVHHHPQEAGTVADSRNQNITQGEFQFCSKTLKLRGGQSLRGLGFHWRRK